MTPKTRKTMKRCREIYLTAREQFPGLDSKELLVGIADTLREEGYLPTRGGSGVFSTSAIRMMINGSGSYRDTRKPCKAKKKASPKVKTCREPELHKKAGDSIVITLPGGVQLISPKVFTALDIARLVSNILEVPCDG